MATAIDGHISEDDKETWLSIEEFKTKHADLLHLTYNEAVDISLKEIEVMKAVDEPSGKNWIESVKSISEFMEKWSWMTRKNRNSTSTSKLSVTAEGFLISH